MKLLIIYFYSASEESKSEKSLQAAESPLESRQARDAIPEAKKKKSARKNKGKKSAKRGKNTGKGKSAKKSKKVKKQLKKKRIRNRQKKKQQKSKRKGKMDKIKGKAGKQASCDDQTKCLDKAIEYWKMVETRVTNYVTQKKRIEKFMKLTESKGGKNGDFKGLKSRIVEGAGGNASALECGGSTTSPAALRVKAAVESLDKCEMDIKTACTGSPPAYNSTEAETCLKAMTSFEDKLKACSNCTCYLGTELEAASATIKKCDLTATNKLYAKFKSSCTKTFAACRQAEDGASQVIHLCRTSSTAIQSKITAVTAVIKELNALVTKAKSLVGASRSHIKRNRRYQQRSMTCAVFIGEFKVVTTKGEQHPLANDTISSATALVSVTVAVCSASEKTTLSALVKVLEAVVKAIEDLLTHLNSELSGIV